MSLVNFAQLPNLLKMLAHELRWQIVSVLARGDRRVSELIAFLEQPANLISYHLRLLRAAGLVDSRRSDSDGRDMYYSLNLSRLQAAFFEAGEQLHPALHVDLSCLRPAVLAENAPAHILFACTHNSARSQMAEALLRDAAGETVEVFSAGTKPSRVHPLAVEVMAERGIDISHQRAKGFEDVADRHFDVVITVCDRAREVCPVFPEHPHYIHWSLPDPSEVGGSAGQRRRAFEATADRLAERIRFLKSQLAEESNERD